MNVIAPIVGTTGTILAGDLLWLTLRQAYHKQLFQEVQGSPLQLRWLAAIPVYALLVFALYFVAVQPARRWQDAAALGATVGAVMYGFYDFTNYSTLTRWTLFMTLTDMAWGAFIGCIAAVVGFASRSIPNISAM